jgi:hypothetical protein
MTRDEWLARARAHLPADLLEQEPKPEAVVVEVIEAEVVEEPPRATVSSSATAPAPVVLRASDGSRAPQRGSLARARRFARRAMESVPLEDEEPRPYGSERIERKALEATERIIDRGMDVLESRAVPRLRSRGGRFARKRGGAR